MCVGGVWGGGSVSVYGQVCLVSDSSCGYRITVTPLFEVLGQLKRDST